MRDFKKALYLTTLKSKMYKDTIKLNRLAVELEGVAGSITLSEKARDPLIESKLVEIKRKTKLANKNLGGC